MAAVSAALLFAPSAQAAPLAVEDLGTLPGDLRSSAVDINDAGSIAGVSYGTGTSQHAVRWDRFDGIKKLADLGFDSWAAAINRDSVVVGYAVNSANQAQAVKWNVSGSLVQLTVAGATSSVAYDVNDSGTVAGTATINGVSQAVLWDSTGVATVLGAGNAHRVTNANWAIGYTGGDVVRWNASGVRTVLDAGTLIANNELGDAGGTVGTNGVLWLRNGRTQLGTGARPFDLSDNGFAVGELSSQAFRWDLFGGGSAPLAPAPSRASEVNNSGVVAGTVGTTAATWNLSGTQTLLPALSGAARHTVTGLSEVGQVIGVATFADGIYRAVVWR
ncbi:hypothetical protein FXN61_41685 [Lentzea sp. PSKA42]|uniref:Extracellular repeat, HAF family n=1 Tax=Lentzea indica TaxID=2604800 RepID=A0ABX1FWC6_9PSEU|nr:hypothetical protein [Lentzea indica]NKE62891.1 hypothetical protein [Lentzea indica]